MSAVTEIFASKVFDDRVMKSRLSAKVYNSLKNTIEIGEKLDITVANAVAEAMKEWALEQGATHYTHWFQPLTGITAEKHDSFISPSPDGRVIMDFSGKELIKGEPDASSFPSGGLRATFEARGYTAWDPTSYAFIKGKTLCIPTAFCSYGGEALDKKTPLLRSMQALNKQALRILKLFGNENVRHVTTSVGPEQEYFLIPKELYDKRKDLIYTGRTLFGAKPPKGQELDDHYFGVIKPRVEAYMTDLNDELWKLGILAKTQHNEVAPAQHELAPIYGTTNIATDHNQLTMEIMKKVAQKHGLVCLLHEKPFDGVNGSGKHNNWSISTDTGVNLLTPGETPYENAQFLLFLCAVIKAVDDYQDLLRISVATAGNDHRLGANEAPPAVISIFLGDELEGILEAIESDKPYEGVEKTVMKLGVSVLPRFTRDTTDRNRTSPFAFTGNKFEFRSPGSRLSCGGPMTIMNTIVAEVLDQFYEKLKDAEDFQGALDALIKETIVQNKRIIFNGNGYSEEWVKEAERRGLLNLRTTPDAIPVYLLDKNVEVLSKHGVYSRVELESRVEILLDEYCKTINIEARTMIDMAKKDILPAVMSYVKDLSETAAAASALGADLTVEKELVTRLSAYAAETYKALRALEEAEEEVTKLGSTEAAANYFRDVVLPRMDALRKPADEMEALCGEKYWPYPTYEQLLFYVK